MNFAWTASDPPTILDTISFENLLPLHLTPWGIKFDESSTGTFEIFGASVDTGIPNIFDIHSIYVETLIKATQIMVSRLLISKLVRE